jgi:pantothenate synthetase
VNRYRVIFGRGRSRSGHALPQRVFYLAAEDEREAFEFARAIEAVLERPTIDRGRTLAQAVIEAVTEDQDD